MLTDRTRIEELGIIADNRHNAFKILTEEEVTCFAPALDNQDTKEVTAGFDRYQYEPTDMSLQKTEKPHYLTAIVPACKTSKIYLIGETFFYVLLIFDTFHINALLNTGAFSSVLPIKLFNLIPNKEPSKILKSSKVFPESVKMADGRVIGVEKCVQIQISIGNCQFTEEFLILKI